MYALKALGVPHITQYITTCIQVSQAVKISIYKLVTTRSWYPLQFGYRELLVRFCFYCVVDLRVGNHLDNLQLVCHTS